MNIPKYTLGFHFVSFCIMHIIKIEVESDYNPAPLLLYLDHVRKKSVKVSDVAD